jgi:hypothetical protein
MLNNDVNITHIDIDSSGRAAFSAALRMSE